MEAPKAAEIYRSHCGERSSSAAGPHAKLNRHAKYCKQSTTMTTKLKAGLVKYHVDKNLYVLTDPFICRVQAETNLRLKGGTS